MGIKTEIAWCDSTVNPVMGCDGCELSGGHCYAESLVTRYAGLKGWPKTFKRPEFVGTIRRLDAARAWSDLTGTDRPHKPWLNGMQRMIFVCDLSDPFSESLPIDWLSPHVDRWKETPHIWMLLTKRPKRMGEFVRKWEADYGEQFPQNIWGGTSVTSQATAWRIADLLAVPSLSVRFLSLEPLLGPVDIPVDAFVCPKCECRSPKSLLACRECKPALSWIIVGGESGPHVRPMLPDWARSIRDQCQAAGVPFFFKQWGEWAPSELVERNEVELWVPVKDRDIHTWPDGTYSYRVGKKTAGRMLDGREWSQFPG